MFIKWNFFSLHKKVEKAFHKTNERRQQQNETLDLCKIMGHYNEYNSIRSTNYLIDIELFWIKFHFICVVFDLTQNEKMPKCYRKHQKEEEKHKVTPMGKWNDKNRFITTWKNVLFIKKVFNWNVPMVGCKWREDLCYSSQNSKFSIFNLFFILHK